MKFSIIIPSCKNHDYLKLCIESIDKNSTFNHEIIVHINGIDHITENLLSIKNLKYTKSDVNIGLCSGVNMAVQKSSTNYIVYAHDDMYFLPRWDVALSDEIKKIDHNLFYLSATQISSNLPGKDLDNHIYFDAGHDLLSFKENKLLNNFMKLNFYNLQGSHWAPHIIHKKIWNKVGGFSQEFDPGFASDPDLNMKLWNEGVRIFKGVNLSRIYHFGSITTRKNINISKNEGNRTFLLKWGFSKNFFIKHYLRRGEIHKGPLKLNPQKNIFYFFDLLISKIKFVIEKLR